MNKVTDNSTFSEPIANFLVELAANERKISYCRQILASNPQFMPLSLFKKSLKSNNTQLYRKQFYHMLQEYNNSYSEQEKMLIFSYFRVDQKQYISYDQFYASIIPQNDNSLKKLIQNRQKDNFTVDYSVQYALNKYFGQVSQSQLDLELKLNFEIQTADKLVKKSFKSKISNECLEQFMNFHGKYPTKQANQCILKEINQNKGSRNRNAMIREYIIKFVSKVKLNKGQLPKVVPYATSLEIKPNRAGFDASSKRKQGSPFKKQAKDHSNSSNLSNPNSSFSQHNTSNSLSLTEVESKIKNLLNAISVKPATLNLTNQNKQNFTQTPSKELNILKDNTPKQIQSIIQIEKQDQREADLDNQSKSIDKNQQNSVTEREKLRKRFNLEEQPVQRKYKSANKHSQPQKSQQSIKSVPKTAQRYSSQAKPIRHNNQGLQAELSHRYRKYNYLRQEKRENTKRLQYLRNLIESPQKNITPFSRRR